MYEETPEQQQRQQQEEDQLGENEVNLNFSTFDELCRLCAIHHGPPKMHIFEPEAEQRQLLYKLRTLLQANVSSKRHPNSVDYYFVFDLIAKQITKDDFLPKHICELCLSRLEHLYEWRQICMRNEHMLRNYAASMHTVRATIDFQVSALRTWGQFPPAAVAAVAAVSAAADKRPSRLPWPKLHTLGLCGLF